jgi:cAMP phosphodiesterase
MKVRILPSSPSSPEHNLYLTAFVVDGTLAVDAGCLGFAGDPGEYADVGSVFLTHSHADHVGALPLFVEDRAQRSSDPLVVHALAHTITSLKEDVFNDRIWPDLIRLYGKRYLELRELEPEVPVQASGLTVTPVLVDHVVPTVGYVVDDGTSTAVFGGDSGPTHRLWEVAGRCSPLRAVFMEASFPDRMSDVADVTKHLTPRLVAAEIEKLPGEPEVIAVHIKPAYRSEVVSELQALGNDRLTIGCGGREYQV